MRRVLACGLLCLCCTTSALKRGVHADSDAPEPVAAAVAPAPEPLLGLAPGEVADLALDRDGAAAQRLATPTGQEQFVLILGSTRFEPRAEPFEYSLRFGQGVSAGPPHLIQSCALPGEAGPLAPPPEDPAPQGPAPREGSTRVLELPTPEGASRVTVRAVSVGAHAVVWVDTTHPTSLDRSFAEQFREDFERVIMPRARQVFGTEPDLDGDGRIQLVFSPLTHQRSVAFFTGCDLVPDMQGCAASNHGEYLYLTPPEAIAAPYNTPNAIKEILTHELSHLLHFNRKVLRNHLGEWPDSVYMIEGVGALAQDVTGYQAGNLHVTLAGLAGLGEFSLTDVLSDEQRQDASRDGLLRGASYLFARYLYDRAGGDSVDGIAIQDRGGPAFLHALIDAPASMAAMLRQITRHSNADIAMDFFTALAMSNRELSAGAAARNPCFAYLPTLQDPVTGKQRGANLFAEFHGMHMAGPHVVDAHSADGMLRPGGVEYLKLDATPGQPELAFALQAQPESLPRLRVGRWR
jgi:hypothetical protein